MLTGFFVLTLNLRIIIKTRWKTLSGLTQPAVVKLLHRTPAPTRSPASLQPPPSFLLSHSVHAFCLRAFAIPVALPGIFFPRHSTCLAVLGEASRITI